jgi:thioredoxin-related protein
MNFSLLKNKKTTFLLTSVAVIGFFSFTPMPQAKEQINWMSFDQAVAQNKIHPKKIFIDVFTSWCGWCKRMDATTYTDKDLIEYMNKNFYAVRLDAETNDTFHFNNHIFVNPGQGRNSVNELAYSLLDGKMSYPTTVYLDEKFNRLSMAPGYLSTDDLKVILKYFAENKYKTLSYQDYKRSIDSLKVHGSN